MILVVGATGYLGGMITQRLLASGQGVRILVRSGSKYGPLVEAGAEPVTGDLQDRPSLDAACSGIATVIATAGTRTLDYDAGVMAGDLRGYGNLIGAARDAGIGHFIFTSALGADAASAIPYIAAKGQIEARLRDSGLAYTILQPSFLMDFWFMSFVYGPVMNGQSVWALGDGRDAHSPVAAQDVAAFAVAAAENADAKNRVIRIGGPQPLSLRDAARIAEHLLGKPVTVRSFTPDEPPAGWSPLMVQLVMLGANAGFTLDTRETAAEFGVPLTSLDEFLGAVPAA